MTRVIPLTGAFLQHIRSHAQCEAAWLADSPDEMCEVGRRLVQRLDGVLEAAMPPDEEEVIPPA